METKHIALVLAIIALTIAASSHGSIALILSIVALVLAFKEDYEEVAVGLGIVSLVLAFLPTLIAIPK